MIELVEIGFLSLATFCHQRSLVFFFMVVVFLKTRSTKCLYYLNTNLIYQEEIRVDKIPWDLINGILTCEMSKHKIYIS